MRKYKFITYLYVCKHTHTQTYKHIYKHTRKIARTYTYKIRIYTYTHTHIYSQIHARARAHIRLCIIPSLQILISYLPFLFKQNTTIIIAKIMTVKAHRQ